MHFEQPPPPPFTTYSGGYPGYFPTQQPTPPGGMPPTRPFYGVHGVPTPSPSPRTPAQPSHSRRQSHDPSGDYPAGFARRPASGYHDYPSYPHPPSGFATPPLARPHTRASAHPLHTPSPSPSAYHGGYPPSGSFSPTPVDAGFVSQPFSYYSSPAPSPRSFYRFKNVHERNTASPASDCDCGVCRSRSTIDGADRMDSQYSPFGNLGPNSPPPRARTSQSQRHNSSRASQWPGEMPKSPPVQSGPVPPRKPLKSKTPIDPVYLKEAAKKAGIPADYSLKNWDPRERPLILLGSVFDANSLGEWIFNWTKFVHGRNHAATKIAASLWDMLIDFAARLKRANDFSADIKKKESKEIVEEFVETADQLWAKLKALLRACEDYMWRAVKSKAGEGAQMGVPSGTEFVDALFNADKEWDRTSKLMNGMDTWCSRFQVNCEEILRRPDA